VPARVRTEAPGVSSRWAHALSDRQASVLSPMRPSRRKRGHADDVRVAAQHQCVGDDGGDPSPCSSPGLNRVRPAAIAVYFQFSRSPELSRYFRALALRRTHRRQSETPNAWAWGANDRRVSRGRHAQRPRDRQSRSLENMQDAGFSRSCAKLASIRFGLCGSQSVRDRR
jgi:hypothetical protein